MGSLLTTATAPDYLEDSSYSEDESPVTTKLPSKPCYSDNSSEDICFDSATDAMDAAPSAPSRVGMITLNQVLEIENQLEHYEKVSLVYLLYEDPQDASKDLNRLLGGSQEKLLYNWAIGQNLIQQKWQEKFVEAVSIIKNYQVLVELGFDKADLDQRFLPNRYYTSLGVNKVRKALYLLVCEDLDGGEVEELLQKVMSDFNSKNLVFTMFDASCLELFLLYWETLGYIKLDDLSNLCHVLKLVDKLDTSEKLKDFVPVVEEPTSKSKSVDAGVFRALKSKEEDIFSKILSPDSNLSDFVSKEVHISASNAIYVNEDNKYHIEPRNPGYCLIINQENFYRECETQYLDLLPPNDIKLESRLGSQKDKKVLEETFKRFGFKTDIADNLDHLQLKDRIGEAIDNVTHESSLFVCIMSHGDEGVVYGVNSCRVGVKRIQKMMCTRNRQYLAGKPKVLILQSCQGNRCQKILKEDPDDITTDGPSSSHHESVPPMADLLTFWATVPGYGAIRNKKSGSWFIQSLCERITDLGNKFHFQDICTMVVNDVSSKKWKQPKDEVAMVPLMDSTWRKLFYLPARRW